MNNKIDEQIKFLQAVKYLLECPQEVIDSIDWEDRKKLANKIKENMKN